jgi:DNA-directed RNA polymerase subunit N (RpoN/RPB10)
VGFITLLSLIDDDGDGDKLFDDIGFPKFFCEVFVGFVTLLSSLIDDDGDGDKLFDDIGFPKFFCEVFVGFITLLSPLIDDDGDGDDKLFDDIGFPKFFCEVFASECGGFSSPSSCVTENKKNKIVRLKIHLHGDKKSRYNQPP